MEKMNYFMLVEGNGQGGGVNTVRDEMITIAHDIIHNADQTNEQKAPHCLNLTNKFFKRFFEKSFDKISLCTEHPPL